MNRAHGLLFTPLALAALTFASCSQDSNRKPTFPVTGKVVLPDGKPAEHATVVLHPVEETGPDVVKPRGKVAADGTFTLTTYDGRTALRRASTASPSNCGSPPARAMRGRRAACRRSTPARRRPA